jgi:multiple sugar transport system permease protein
MARSRAAIICAAVFLVLFFVSGVDASMTVKENSAAISLGLGDVLFTLSSISVLLLPLSLACMLISIIGLIKNQRSVGMLFAGIATIVLAVYMIMYSREGFNSSLYARLSDIFSDQGIKFKKRDADVINIAYSVSTYFTLCAGAMTAYLAAPPMKTAHERHMVRRSILPYAYIGPHLFFFIIFFIMPAVYGIYAAFTRWNLFNDPIWAGFENFRTLLFESGNTYYKQLRNGLKNTFLFVIFSVPFCILLPLGLAVALRTRCRGNKFFQAIYYLPALMSISTVSIAWRYMFFKSYGVMTHFFMSPADWLVPPYSWVSLVMVTMWWVNGGTMVIYQSALSSIPVEHYEAAASDGANAWQKFWYVTLPGIRYPLAYTLMAQLVAQFNIYGQPLFLTGFGNQEGNAVLLMYVIENAVKKQVAGISAAMAFILGLCILTVSMIQLRVMRANAPD